MSSLTRRIAQGAYRVGRTKGKAYRTGLASGGYPKRLGISIARLNRHTGQPHQHSREIARRLRQAK